MTVNKLIVFTIIGCGLVTWLPRIFPFIITKKVKFPKLVEDFLSYIPMCILTALFVQGLFIQQSGDWAKLNNENFLASIPTLLVAIFTKNLMWTVLVGILTMAFLRFMI